jgi:hypothetical protein
MSRESVADPARLLGNPAPPCIRLQMRGDERRDTPVLRQKRGMTDGF